jgi:hypothetical protein
MNRGPQSLEAALRSQPRRSLPIQVIGDARGEHSLLLLLSCGRPSTRAPDLAGTRRTCLPYAELSFDYLIRRRLHSLWLRWSKRIMAEPWPWDQRPDCAVITERAIVEDGAPILHVTHDLDDHGWQFLGGGYVDVDKAVAVCLTAFPSLTPQCWGYPICHQAGMLGAGRNQSLGRGSPMRTSRPIRAAIRLSCLCRLFSGPSGHGSAAILGASALEEHCIGRRSVDRERAGGRSSRSCGPARPEAFGWRPSAIRRLDCT